jgi:hypothetical protein
MSFFRDPVSPPRSDKLAERPDDRDVLYRESNLVTRAVVGILGSLCRSSSSSGRASFSEGARRLEGPSAPTITLRCVIYL